MGSDNEEDDEDSEAMQIPDWCEAINFKKLEKALERCEDKGSCVKKVLKQFRLEREDLEECYAAMEGGEKTESGSMEMSEEKSEWSEDEDEDSEEEKSEWS